MVGWYDKRAWFAVTDVWCVFNKFLAIRGATQGGIDCPNCGTRIYLTDRCGRNRLWRKK